MELQTNIPRIFFTYNIK